MKTYQATLTVILWPGVARDAAEAEAVLRSALGARPGILAYRYAKVNGELKSPQEVEVTPPRRAGGRGTPHDVRLFVGRAAAARPTRG